MVIVISNVVSPDLNIASLYLLSSIFFFLTSDMDELLLGPDNK